MLSTGTELPSLRTSFVSFYLCMERQKGKRGDVFLSVFASDINVIA